MVNARRSSRRFSLSAAIVLAWTTAFWAAMPASAIPDQTPDDPVGPVVIAGSGGRAAPAIPGVSLAIVDQMMTVAGEGTVALLLSLSGTVPADHTLVVIGYRKLEGRQAVAAVVGGGRNRSTVSVVDLGHPDALARDEAGIIRITLGTTASDDPAMLRLSEPGLYPIGIALRDTKGTAKNEQLSFLERVPDAAPLGVTRVGVAVNIDGAPSLQPSGNSVITDDVATDLDAVISLLTTTPFAVDLSVRPELLDGLALSANPRDRSRLSELTAAIGDRHHVLAVPYVSIEPTFAFGSGLSTQFTELLRLGEDVISDRLGIVADRTVWQLTDGIDPPGVEMLRDLGIRHFLVSDDLVLDDGASLTGTSGVLASFEQSNNSAPVLMAEPALNRAFGHLRSDDVDPTSAADRPNAITEPRFLAADVFALGIEVDGPSGFASSPDRSLLIVLDDVSTTDISALNDFGELIASHPRIELSAPSDIVRQADRATPIGHRANIVLAAAESTPNWELLDSLLRVDRGLSTTISMLPAGDERPARWNALRRVLVSQRMSENERDSYIAQLDGELGELRNAISLPETPKFNLGGKESVLPLVVENTGPTPLDVIVRFTSPNNKVTFTQNDIALTVVDRESFLVPVRVRSNGQTPIIVQVLTPAGPEEARELIGPTRLSLSTNLLSGIGQMVTLGLLGVLVLWWVHHARKVRRAKRASVAYATSLHPASSVLDS